VTGELLKPVERKKLGEALAACSRCNDRIHYAKQIGIDTSEYEARAKALEQSIEGALAVDRQTIEKK
jgi:hypothetical protein